MSPCRPVRTWSNWTGSTPCWIGKVWLSLATGAWGVPGETSTKKLPSRKMRGRMANVASSWIGSPWLVMFIVTSAAWQAFWVVLADLQPGSWPTAVTVPTLTPAMRTSEPGWSPLALAKVAWTVYLWANGLANFV